ncbi:OmpA family protein [Vulcaniibacterium tengchongense]|uniref:OOP family OmpA-OmpF porin n=1 Tax=Vulcaniibacterium tengchongense TaxID=1273429 RepID=A0A3N4VCA1_9GAMM|nr:OmpA family protein [Vulcaniibacterium tengchongense]RPE77301.1 OOP family OmpA-OmpF porin [Vulcaniibacterium tengchongense]
MNKKLLCAALLGGLAVAQAASAQEFDDRWYLTGSAGFNIQDNDRGTRNAPFGAIGLGKFLNENWSLDGELNYQNPNNDANQDLNWSQYGISLDLRRHFTAEGRNWAPYILMGLGYQRSEEEFDAFPSPNSPGEREDGNLAAKVGVGIQSALAGKRAAIRTELAYRADFDDTSVSAPSEDWFGDVLASVGVVIPLGAPAVAAPPPAPAAPSCADLDDDGDGVNNCDDKCPGSQAGQTIGPDGCPVPVSIDLKGVNFDFDKSTLRADAVAILSEAVQILQRYPELRVEVAGHTDLCGTDAYNQKLSERRAKAVYDYLTSNGIDASRLVGPIGYGESRPLEPTAQTLPGCKSERNRRTELNVQN